MTVTAMVYKSYVDRYLLQDVKKQQWLSTLQKQPAIPPQQYVKSFIYSSFKSRDTDLKCFFPKLLSAAKCLWLPWEIHFFRRVSKTRIKKKFGPRSAYGRELERRLIGWDLRRNCPKLSVNPENCELSAIETHCLVSTKEAPW
jgi:hypothetical protein